MSGKRYETVFLLDMSGSMRPMRQITLDGYNSMLREQKNTEKEVRVTTVVFNTECRSIHSRVPIGEISELTAEDYVPDGCTALYDAIGQTITELLLAQLFDPEGEAETLFVISTDGQENASGEYTAERVRELIRQAERDFRWEFVFLGAGEDTILEAEKLEIRNTYSACRSAEGHRMLNQKRWRKLKDFLE